VFSGHKIARHRTGTTSLDPPQCRAEEIGAEPRVSLDASEVRMPGELGQYPVISAGI
jgi:hypothetical protein